MPDIEKRLEAFVRMAHGIVIFPGGAGTAKASSCLMWVKRGPGLLPMHVVGNYSVYSGVHTVCVLFLPFVTH